MELKLYSTKDNENVINKTLELKYTINIKLKKTTDITEPIIILNDNNVMNFNDCNYAYISGFNRYYFIRSIENMSNHNWSLYLECDVLESFKDDILNSQCEIERKITRGDYQNRSLEFQVLKEVDIYKSNVILDDESTLILSTIGG